MKPKSKDLITNETWTKAISEAIGGEYASAEEATEALMNAATKSDNRVVVLRLPIRKDNPRGGLQDN